jgi:hypothetical protein
MRSRFIVRRSPFARPRPKVLPRNLVGAAEVPAGKPQLAANEEQPSLPHER